MNFLNGPDRAFSPSALLFLYFPPPPLPPGAQKEKGRGLVWSVADERGGERRRGALGLRHRRRKEEEEGEEGSLFPPLA